MESGVKGGISFGFLCIAVAAVASHRHPATGYEWSIYTATPLLTWACISAAVVTCILLALRKERGATLGATLLLLLSAITILSLPTIRGYFHMGQADSVTHLGIILDVLQNQIGISDIVYPAYHFVSAEISLISGLDVNRAAQLSILAFAVSYLIATPLLSRRLSLSTTTGFIGAVGAAMVLPLMTVRLPIYAPIPNTAAALFLPMILLGSFVPFSGDSHRPRSMVLLYILLIAGVLLHPVLGVVLISFTLFYRQNLATATFSFASLFLIVSYTWWLAQFTDKLIYFAEMWTRVTEGKAAGASISAAGDSLSQIGISIQTLAMKIVIPKLFALALAGLLFCLLLKRWLNGSITRRESQQIRFSISFAPLAVLVVCFFVVGLSNQWSRYLGMALGPATVVAAVAVPRVKNRIPAGGSVATVLAVVLLVLSTLVIYPSPWLVRPNPQVTTGQVTGYNHAFEYSSSETKIDALSSEPRRFRNAYYGTMHKPDQVGENYERIVYRPRPDSIAPQTLRQHYDGKTMFVSTEIGRTTHTRLYEEAVYSATNISKIQAESPIKLYSNGDTNLYLINGTGEFAQ